MGRRLLGHKRLSCRPRRLLRARQSLVVRQAESDMTVGAVIGGLILLVIAWKVLRGAIVLLVSIIATVATRSNRAKVAPARRTKSVPPSTKPSKDDLRLGPEVAE